MLGVSILELCDAQVWQEFEGLVPVIDAVMHSQLFSKVFIFVCYIRTNYMVYPPHPGSQCALAAYGRGRSGHGG